MKKSLLALFILCSGASHLLASDLFIPLTKHFTEVRVEDQNLVFKSSASGAKWKLQVSESQDRIIGYSELIILSPDQRLILTSRHVRLELLSKKKGDGIVYLVKETADYRSFGKAIESHLKGWAKLNSSSQVVVLTDKDALAELTVGVDGKKTLQNQPSK